MEVMTLPNGRAKFMGSSIKIGGRWFFKTALLFGVDLAEDAELPTRGEILADRKRRANDGEVLRPGRHADGCQRDHESKTCSTSTQKAGRNRDSKRVRNSILNTLGK